MKKRCFICGNNQYVFFREKKFTYYKCKNCGFVATYPLPTLNEIENHYKKNYLSGNYMLLKKYSSDYSNNYQKMAKKLEKVILKEKKTLKGLKILDIGCFTGDFLEILNKKGAQVHGIELQEEAAEIAQKKFPGKIITIDATSLNKQIKENSLDCITMLGFVEHVCDPKTILSKATKLLKSGGILMIQTPNTNSFPALITGKLWPPYTPTEHIYLFSSKSLRFELERLGFKDFKARRHLKVMPFSYLYQILGTFGPDWKKILSPLFLILPNFLKNIPIPFYVGEYIYFARKK